MKHNPYLITDDRNLELRDNEGSDSSDLEEEMARDYECYPESDDDEIRRGNYGGASLSAHGRTAALSSYSVNPSDDDMARHSQNTRQSNLRLRVMSSKAGSPRTNFSKATTARAIER